VCTVQSKAPPMRRLRGGGWHETRVKPDAIVLRDFFPVF
jgi:hypothetical protein